MKIEFNLPFSNDKIIREMAEEHNMSFGKMKKIVESQYEATKMIIESGIFDKIRLKNLGLFHAPDRMVDPIRRRKLYYGNKRKGR